MTFEEYHEINRKYGCKIMPFDIEFDDGAMFCVDREQIEFVEVDQ